MKKQNTISILIVFAFIAVGFFIVSNSRNISYVNIGGQKIKVELAVTKAERVQGLSGRKSLDEGTGLLFIFEESGLYPFWMKDMNFPIDIIWLSEDQKIVFIKSNAKPSDFPKTYNPEQDAKYVLEVPAGFSEKYKLKAGGSAIFNY